MQKYHSIADVALQLKIVADKKNTVEEVIQNDIVVMEEEEQKTEEKVIDGGGDEHEEYDSPESEITDSGKLYIILLLINSFFSDNYIINFPFLHSELNFSVLSSIFLQIVHGFINIFLQFVSFSVGRNIWNWKSFFFALFIYEKE